jgi:hypothetical protein
MRENGCRTGRKENWMRYEEYEVGRKENWIG